ncbi:MAG: 50S ribosomal protein L4 [Phycisphaeraceae bacterium]|nr:50S ribosomal protein L4 [Phycisphaeraceae bacterium]MCW5754325.1 50S ribosomal protein L4 [Phycisphaeraceae bacterium]
MLDVPVYNKQGVQVGSMPIDEQALGGAINAALIKQAYVVYHANKRQGSARTKSRAEVEGSTRKIYKQKGTGNARHGDRRPPQFRGGGHTFAKHRTREDYHQNMPIKMRRRANRNALLGKLRDDEVRVIDSLAFDTPRTKDFKAMLEALKIDRKALVALSMDPARCANARLSARNIDDVSLCRVDQMTCFEMLNHRYLIIEKSDLEAWLTGPSSRTDKSGKANQYSATAATADASAGSPARAKGKAKGASK